MWSVVSCRKNGVGRVPIYYCMVTCRKNAVGRGSNLILYNLLMYNVHYIYHHIILGGGRLYVLVCC